MFYLQQQEDTNDHDRFQLRTLGDVDSNLLCSHQILKEVRMPVPCHCGQVFDVWHLKLKIVQN